MRPLLFAALLILAGCDATRTTSVRGTLSVSPSELDFGEGFVGVDLEKAVSVTNGSRASAEVRAQVTGPFTLEERTSIPAGTTVTIPVHARPMTEGEFTGTLSLESDLQTVTVSLHGVAVKPPLCAATSPCRMASFSTQSAQCVETPVPDGTACSSPCLEGASSTCLAGVCVGVSAACDDGDACTVDACGTTGCLHAPAECSAAGPCQSARCDPVLGCVVEPSADGSDCGDGRVCVSGSCIWQRYTDAQLCATASPCQAAGTWDGTQCLRPPKSTLQPAWTYTAAPGHQIGNLVVAADDGSLYFTDDDLGAQGWSSRLVSLARDGTERFGVPVGRPYGARGLTVDGASVLGVEYTLTSNAIVARDRNTGQEQWRFDASAELGMTKSAGHLGLLDDRKGRLVTQVSEDFNTRPIWVVSIDLQTRQILWTFEVPPSSFIDGMDEQGRILLHREDPREVVVLDRDGTELWSMPSENPHCDGFAHGFYLDERGQVFDSSDGGFVLQLPAQGSSIQGCTSPRTILPGMAVMLGREYAPGESWRRSSSPPTHIFTQQLPAGLATAATPEDGKGMALSSWPKLTTRGGILSAISNGTGDYALREVRTTGEVLFECPLPQVSPACCGLSWYGLGQVLAPERWYVTGPYVYGNEPAFIRALDVPGVMPHEGPGW